MLLPCSTRPEEAYLRVPLNNDTERQQIVILGYKIGLLIKDAVIKRKSINRPVNILFTGPPGSKKTTIITIVKDILEKQYKMKTEAVKLDTKNKTPTLKDMDIQYRDADLILIESTVAGLPKDYETLDLYVKLEGGLFERQQWLTSKTESMEFAQIATAVSERALSAYTDKAPELLLNTDFIDLEFHDSGGLRKLLETGIHRSLQSGL